MMKSIQRTPQFFTMMMALGVERPILGRAFSTLQGSEDLRRKRQLHGTKHNVIRKTTTEASHSEDPDTSMMDIRRQMEQDGKYIESVSTAEFVFMFGIMVPIWATVMLPMTVTYQIFKGIRDRISPPKEFSPQSPFDSGYKVQAQDIVPCSARRLDIVVLGATGFAGKLAVRHLAKTYGVGKSVQWAIAGRSKEKLDKVMADLGKELNMPELANVELIIADTSVPSTLPHLVRDTRAVVSTAGPFWQYGSAVVEFCAKFGTNYADITGESSWVKSMMARWQNTAKQTGAKIVCLAGHDCIPWDLSVSFLATRLLDETGEDLKEVTCFVEAKSSPSGGTFETILMGASGTVPSTPPVNPFRYRADGSNHSQDFSANLKPYLSKITKPWDHQQAWGSPFFMSIINQDVISWSQALRGGMPLTYSEVAVNPDWKTAVSGYFQLVLFITAILNPVTKSLLMKFVLPRPGEGPSLENMENDSFLTVSTIGTGTAGSTAEAVMYFPRDAGYLDTARMVVESGLCMALQEDQLPVTGGGFFSPGFVLGETLLGRLTSTGTSFYSKITKAA
jgi:short subunit dehydrogenase-like uncharacterized protein